MSEFGKGFAYCLGLFLAHTERAKMFQNSELETKYHHMAPSGWFSAAALSEPITKVGSKWTR